MDDALVSLRNYRARFARRLREFGREVDELPAVTGSIVVKLGKERISDYQPVLGKKSYYCCFYDYYRSSTSKLLELLNASLRGRNLALLDISGCNFERS